MAINYSTNKIRVTNLLGGGGYAGLMDPVSGMPVYHGAQPRYIVALDSGNYHVSLALTLDGPIMAEAYTQDLAILSGVAFYSWAWPTGVGDVRFGHHGIFPSGVTMGMGSGMTFENSDGTMTTFGR